MLHLVFLHMSHLESCSLETVQIACCWCPGPHSSICTGSACSQLPSPPYGSCWKYLGTTSPSAVHSDHSLYHTLSSLSHSTLSPYLPLYPPSLNSLCLSTLSTLSFPLQPLFSQRWMTTSCQQHALTTCSQSEPKAVRRRKAMVLLEETEWMMNVE